MTNEISSTRKSLSIAAIIMMSSVLLSRVIGIIRERVLANMGGTSIDMDAYVTSFMIPDLLNHFLASGFLSITFIPIFQKHLARSNPEEAWRSFSNLLTLGSLLFFIMIPGTMLLAPQLLKTMGPHINNPEIFPLTLKLTRIILPAQLFFYWGAFFNAVQMARHRFFLPALTPLVYNAGIIAGGFILGPRLGIEGFAWGVLAGSFLGNVALQLPGALATGMRYIPGCNWRHPDVRIYLIKTLPLIFGVSMSFSTEIFFRYFGSFLSEGGTSSVNYALRTMMIVVGVFGQASGVAFFPFLSELAAKKKYEEMTSLLNNLLHKIAIFLIPVTAALYISAQQVIALLYQNGEFDHSSTIKTASVFCIYIFGSFFYSAAIIIVRSFYALQNMIIPLITSTAIFLLSIPLYIFFSRAAGPRGMALAAIIGMVAQFVVLYTIWNSRYGSFRAVKSEFLFLSKVTGISTGAAIVVSALQPVLEPSVNKLSAIFPLQLITSIAIKTLPLLLIVGITYELTGIQKLKDSLRNFKEGRNNKKGRASTR